MRSSSTRRELLPVHAQVIARWLLSWLSIQYALIASQFSAGMGLVCSFLPSLTGALGVLCPSSALAMLALVALLPGLIYALIHIEVGVALLVVVLCMGMETLDMSRLLASPPILSRLWSIVPTASVNFYDLLAGLLIVSVALRLIAQHRKPYLARAARTVGRPLLSYLAVVLLTTVIAHFAVPFAHLGWSLLYLLRLVFSMAPCGLIVLVQPDQAWTRRYTGLFVLLALVPVLSVALLQAWDVNTASLRSYFGLIVAGGFSPMGLGTYLISVIGICVAVVVFWRRRDRPLTVAVALIILLASALTIVLVQKRAAFVGLLAGLLALPLAQSLLPPNPQRRRWRLVVLLIAVVAVAGTLRGGILDRTFLSNSGTIAKLRTIDQETMLPEPLKFLAQYGLDPNITGRVGQWYHAAEAALRYPLGVGFRAMATSPYGYPHNQYLQVIDESSTIGLGCFMWLMLSVFRLSLTLLRKEDRLSILLGSGVFSGLVGMLVQGMFEEAFHNWDGMALLWLLVGLAVVQSDRQQNAHRQADTPLGALP